MLEKVIKGPFTLLNFREDEFNICISTAENGIDFKIGNKNFKENISQLKKILNLDDICYLKQTHSTSVLTNRGFHGEVEGDAIITSERNIGIGVFTADCVPILIWDKYRKIIAAIHSGWKGTYNNIIQKTVSKLVEQYSCDSSNLKALIGPHIKSCCYEVDLDLINKFKSLEIFKNEEEINKGRYLDLEQCVRIELLGCGLKIENVYSTPYCTNCEEEVRLHSYRKTKEDSGRLFSVIYFN